MHSMCKVILMRWKFKVTHEDRSWRKTLSLRSMQKDIHIQWTFKATLKQSYFMWILALFFCVDFCVSQFSLDMWHRKCDTATDIVSYGILMRGKFKVTLEDTYWKKHFLCTQCKKSLITDRNLKEYLIKTLSLHPI